MNVVFATDRNYIQHLSVAILSLLTNNPNSSFNIYIINTDITSEEWSSLVKLDKLTKHFFFDAKINEDELNNLVTSSHYTKANYYRLFIPEIVQDDKALYIDADVVINGQLDELWKTNISEVYLAAVEDAGFFDRHAELEMNPNSKYFNSGVMLLNLKKWREESIKNKVINFIKRKSDFIFFVDQCGLNAVIDGRWKSVHPKFNMQTAFIRAIDMGQDLKEKEKIKEAIISPTIIHFTESSKPWHFLNNHPYKSNYWHYVKLTSFREARPEFNKIIPESLRVKYLLVKYLPKWLKIILKRLYVEVAK